MTAKTDLHTYTHINPGHFSMSDTANKDYTKWLLRSSSSKWKKLLDVQAPYRWNLRRLNLGYTLDVGCGIGRNLANLSGHGVGVDHNKSSVEICRDCGFVAYTVIEFFDTFRDHHVFDSILISHVVEHMTFDEALALIQSYLPFLKARGKIVLIVPQKYGFRADPTHVEYFDRPKLDALLKRVGFSTSMSISFPFPAFFGEIFRYNEYCVVGTR